MADLKDDLHLYFCCKCLGLITKNTGFLKIINRFLLFFGSLMRNIFLETDKHHCKSIQNVFRFYTLSTCTIHYTIIVISL